MRAGHGIQELFQRPSVQVRNRVGQRISASDRADGPDYIVGDELDELLASGANDIKVTYPIREGSVRDWSALLAIWYV